MNGVYGNIMVMDGSLGVWCFDIFGDLSVIWRSGARNVIYWC